VAEAVTAPTRDEVEAVLDERVRPLLKQDGGNVRLEKAPDDGTIVLCLTGRCAGCPGADVTLEALIEPCLRQAFPGIRRVALVPWHLPFFGAA
jgi:Fe-S cluster biogenesis protein NfuA